MPSYLPTVNPGDTRQRAHYIGIRNTLNRVPYVDIEEQVAVRLADGERVLEHVGTMRVEFDPNEVVELRDPVTDALLGSQTTAGAVMAGVYSWVRAKQLARDAAVEAPE